MKESIISRLEVKKFLQEVFLLWQDAIRLREEVNFFQRKFPFDVGSHLVTSGSKKVSALSVPFVTGID